MPPNSYEIIEITFIYETEPEIDAVMTRAQRLREDQLLQNKDDFPLLDSSDNSNAKQTNDNTSMQNEQNSNSNSNSQNENITFDGRLSRIKEAQRRSNDFRL